MRLSPLEQTRQHDHQQPDDEVKRLHPDVQADHRDLYCHPAHHDTASDRRHERVEPQRLEERDPARPEERDPARPEQRDPARPEQRDQRSRQRATTDDEAQQQRRDSEVREWCPM